MLPSGVPAESAFSDAADLRRREFDEVFHCFVTLLPDDGARRAGPLSDVEVAVKDCIDVAGVRGTWGSALLADRVASEDAAVVAQLRHAGARIVGTANLHEFAFGGTTQNPHFGFCRNAWNPDRVCGGSSGGSAVAVALGLCDLGVGTDTGASIRLPAALNGVFGLRPTHGVVSASGVMPVSPPHDTVGFIARDLRILRRAIAQTYRYDARDRFSVAAAGARRAGMQRVGVVADFVRSAEPGVRHAIEAALSALRARGCELVPVASPEFDGIADTLSSVVIADAAAFHRDRLAHGAEAIGTLVRQRIAAGLTMRATDYAHALRRLEAFSVTMRAVFEEVDLLVCPTVPVTPPAIDDVEDGALATRRLTRCCWIAPAAGLPALTVPCGIGPLGVPVGLQLIGPRHSELSLLAFSARYAIDRVPAVDRSAYVHAMHAGQSFAGEAAVRGNGPPTARAHAARHDGAA
jgi:aspartyl-tRNA(Asn)/glutamyl-tRNA(Gln) amidotransferase subunit A